MTTRRGILVAVLATLLVSGAVLALAASSSGYSLNWFTVDGGGGASTGGGYSVSGTLGQPDAGHLSGGGYSVQGGFWGGAVAAPYTLYLPLTTR